MTAGHFCWWILNPWSDSCFIDMESTAAWLQAIFSVATMYLTYHLYKREIENNQQSKIDAEQARRLSQTQMVNQFANVAQSLVLDILDYHSRISTENQSYVIIKTICVRIEEVVIWSRGFALDTMTNEELGKFVNVRSTMHRISTWLLSGQHARGVQYQGYIPGLYEQIENDLIYLSTFR